MSTSKNPLQDPRNWGPRPPFPQQETGTGNEEAVLKPAAIHGEDTYQGSGRLRDMVALITGGDSGIGRAVALAFAREGADVAISYLSSHEDAQQTAGLIEAEGRKALLLPGDVGDPAHCAEIVAKAARELGGLHILVNNAAYQETHTDFQEVTPEEVQHTFSTNVFSAIYLSQAAMKHLPPGGSIINVVSIQAYQPSGALLPYAATKGALTNFTKSLAELAIESGIRVNAVAPGPVWTPLIPSTMPPEKVKTFGENTLLGRPAQPAELAPVFVLLASPEASYITGMIYGITGGSVIS